jgi:hypothetical protein
MNTNGLSLNTIPPILVPLRFFLTAPFFGILAALLLLLSGPQIWDSRWLPNTLAWVHLLTIGFMLMVMIGALYQFIPVMIGRLIPGNKLWVSLIHLLLIVGSVALSVAFLTQLHFFYGLALISLSVSLFLFFLSLLPLLIAKLTEHLIVFLLRMIFVVLFITIIFGLFMLLAYTLPELTLNYRYYTNIHALWGLFGWLILLIISVTSQVIPMFFVTPEFSVSYLKKLALLLVLTLLAISLSYFIIIDSYLVTLSLNIVLSMELFFLAAYVLLLISQRQRKLPDITLNFIRLSMISLFLAIIVAWLLYFFSEGFKTQLELTLGILLIDGVAISAIIGMLQKIMPFLIYLHLQNLSFKHPEAMLMKPKLVLNMKQIISQSQSKKQFMLHLSALFLLIMSLYWSAIFWLASVLFLMNFMWLTYSVFNAFFLLQKNTKKILTYPKMIMDFNF